MEDRVIEILKEYDNLVLDITEMILKVRINDAPFRDATDIDRLELLREEWFRVTEKLCELGYDVQTN